MKTDAGAGRVIQSLTIDERFEGPPAICNGGYACGILGEHFEDPVAVRLHHPVLVERPLSVTKDSDGARLLSDEVVLGDARPAPAPADIPPPVSFEAATAASAASTPWDTHPFPNCFVCGPHRCPGDGLHLLSGLVGGTDLWACPWVPDSAWAGPDGEIPERIVWAALDCPSYWPVIRPGEVALLGTMAGFVAGRVSAGRPHVLVSRAKGRTGRKMWSGSALFSETGALLAAAEVTLIQVTWEAVARATGVLVRPQEGL